MRSECAHRQRHTPRAPIQNAAARVAVCLEALEEPEDNESSGLGVNHQYSTTSKKQLSKRRAEEKF